MPLFGCARWSLVSSFYVSSSIWVEFVSKNCVLMFSRFSLGMRFSSLRAGSIGSSGGLIFSVFGGMLGV